MEDLEYDDLALWEDGVTEENIEALAELTEDVVGRLDYFIEMYEKGEVGSERLENLMMLGNRTIEAEKRLLDDPDYDGEGYVQVDEDFGQEIEEETDEMMEALDVDPENIGKEQEQYLELEDTLPYVEDPQIKLSRAQRNYMSTLEEIRELEGIEVIEPERSEFDQRQEKYVLN